MAKPKPNNGNAKPQGKPQNGSNGKPTDKAGTKHENYRSSIINHHDTPSHEQMRKVHNHAEWKYDSRGMLEAAAKFGFYYPNGRAYMLDSIGADGSKTFSGVPTILTCEYVPIPGYSKDANSAVSIAAQQIFQHIRESLNKTLTGYHFADPFIAYQAFVSLVIQAQEMIRDMKVMNTWSTSNFSWPSQVMRALGYNDDAQKDLRGNMANYIARFNMAMYNASAIFLPMETNALKKFEMMASQIWGDKENEKSQLYLYTCAGYYQYTDLGEQGTKASYVSFDQDNRLKADQLFAYKLLHFETCVAALRDSDSYNYMMSDLRTAYDGVQGYVFPSMNISDSMQLSYSKVWLRQFQNLRTVPECRINHEKTDLSITQDINKNAVIIKPKIAGALTSDPLYDATNEYIEDNYLGKYGEGSMLVNFSTNKPEATEVIDNMDGVTHWHYDKVKQCFEFEEGDYCWYIPIRFHMYVPKKGADGSPSIKDIEFTSWLDFADTQRFVILSNIVYFDWFPMIHIYRRTDDGTTITNMSFKTLVEDDYLAPVTGKQRIAMNQAAQLGIWKIDSTI